LAVGILDEDQWKAKDLLAQNGLGGLQQAIATAIAEERERCAQVAEHLNGWGKPKQPELAHHIAKVIRQG
jgi:hypothetical protein